MILQSRKVLTRPWVILELYTALTHDVPIVALNIQNSYRYDYSQALEFMMYFDQEIEIANPGAAQLLIEQGVDPEDVAWRLSDSLPNIISTDFNPNASNKIIKASLEDLVDTMRHAKPMSPTMTKEEWRAMRTARSCSSAISGAPAKKPHGSSIHSGNNDKSSSGNGVVANGIDGTGSSGIRTMETLARLPSTVPELPTSYLVREADISQLKSALLQKNDSGSSSQSTVLTSKAGKQAKQKIGAHGMGGVGKTTIAAALVHDEDVQSAFTKIVWLSVGQEPVIRELQDSCHFQLTDCHLPEESKSETEVLQVLRKAAKGVNMLLVLDDVWESKHEKPFTCLDPDNNSRLLVTTRIRGLMQNSTEVEMGVLDQPEALKLLLTTADIDIRDVDESSDEYRIATEIVELCGCLPLTLAIAGGMIAENAQLISEDILEAMTEKQELEDDEGMTVETRVISSSVRMMIKSAGKNKSCLSKVFNFFACFPEDVPVPAAFFKKMAPLLSDDKNEKKRRLAVGSSLNTLLKYNLIKGSLVVGSGAFMHDIVRGK